MEDVVGMVLRLTVLNDNTGAPGLLNGWGWSILAEDSDSGLRILFDSGPKPEILEYNSRVLGVPLEGLDLFVVSHEHWDHTGGAPTVAAHNPGLPTIVPPGDHEWSLGLDLSLVFNTGGGSVDGDNALVLSEPLYAPSVGLYEHSLAIYSPLGPIVLVGCSHPGVSRLVESVLEIGGWDRAFLVIGGYHGPSRSELDRLLELSVYVSPVHCSGSEAVEYVRLRRPESLVLVRTGSRVVVGGDGLRVEY